MVKMFYIKEKKNNRKGTILLIAVMIMATILTAALGTGTLVINTINQSASIDYAITAYYAAESGIELNLYQARKVLTFQKESIPLKVFGDNPAEADVTLDISSPLQAGYDFYIVNGKDQIIVDLKQNIEYQLNIYDPTIATTDFVTPYYLDFDGEAPSQNIKLQISWVSWSGGNMKQPQSVITTVQADASIEESVSPVNIESAHLHKVRIRALDGDLDGLIITARDSSGTSTAIPGIYVLRAFGEYPKNKIKKSTQILNVAMPIIEPTYGLYNFVIFSEGDISKSVSW